MPTVTVKNIPADIYEKLKQSAEASHRSINSEIIACIEHTVRSQAIAPELVLAGARRLREMTASYVIGDDEFDQAKEDGRL